jgi:hypothetical protein
MKGGLDRSDNVPKKLHTTGLQPMAEEKEMQLRWMIQRVDTARNAYNTIENEPQRRTYTGRSKLKNADGRPK